MAIEDHENLDQETSPTNTRVTGGGGLEGNEIQWPPWVNTLLNKSQFSRCTSHGSGGKTKGTIYCLDCDEDESWLCLRCLDDHNNDHRTIQIRKLDNHNVIRVNEVENLLDISSIKTYVKNKATAVFLNRPQRGSVKGATNICEVCSRGRVDDRSRFCSLSCKVEATSKGIDKRVKHTPTEAEGSSNSSAVDNNVSNVVQSVVPSKPQLPVPGSHRRRPRKGNPSQSPLQ